MGPKVRPLWDCWAGQRLAVLPVQSEMGCPRFAFAAVIFTVAVALRAREYWVLRPRWGRYADGGRVVWRNGASTHFSSPLS